MQQLTNDQGSDAWFESRLGRATASKFNDIMAKGRNGSEPASRRNYREQLVDERLSGERAENFKSASMSWGTDYESAARLAYEFKTGNAVEETGFYAHDTLMAGASPDGLIGEDGLLEIKCPNSSTHRDTLKKQEVPNQYRWQIQGQLWITGRKWCDFVSYDPRLPSNAQLFITRVDRDDNAIAELEGQVTTFLREVAAEVQFIENYKED